MNVLIGQNGAGKSTLLDAIAMELLSIALVIQNELGKEYIAEILPNRDVRTARIDKGDTTTFEPQYPASVQVVTRIHGDRIECASFARELRGKISHASADSVPSFDVRDPIRWAVQDGFDVTLPLIAYYGTGRMWRGLKDKDEGGKNQGEWSRLSGYRDCLDPSTNLSKMRAWFRRMELLALQDNHTPAVLEASKRAMLQCLDGFDSVRYDARLDDLAARSKKTGLFLSFEQLSDGQRNMLGMVADMAFRAATLNPHLGANAAAQTSGIVLIDEIDLHLHPAWQRRIAGDLQKAFPHVQFIVTTHSPQVLSAVSEDAVLVLEDNQFFRPPAPTRGRDSNSLLTEVFGASVRPVETAARIVEITRLLDDCKYDEARKQLDLLATELTERDPDISRLRNILDIVEGFDEDDSKGQ
jgi:predicted ATP-binding protein involved in virulence